MSLLAFSPLSRRDSECDTFCAVTLFSDTDVNMARAAQLKIILAEVEQYPRDYILSIDVEHLVKYLWQKYRFEVPIIHFDKKVIVDDRESGRGVYVRVSFPYEGFARSSQHAANDVSGRMS